MAPPYRTLLISLSLILPGLLSLSSPGFTQDVDGTFIPVLPQPPTEDRAVRWNLNQAENGLLSSLKISFDKPEKTQDMSEKVGWEYRVETDGMIVLQDSLPGDTQTAEQFIAVDTMPDGDHTLVLTVRDFQGRLHTQEQSFRINGSPRIHISSPEGKRGLINPKINVSFFSEQDGVIGFVEVFLDDRLLIGTGINKDQNQSPIALANLLGNALYAADVPPGTHLLTVTAISLNGSRAERSVTVMGNSKTPAISIRSNGENRVKRIEVTFPPSSRNIRGSADIHYNRSIILSLQTEDMSLPIPRETIEQALSIQGIKIDQSPLKMNISTYSANQIENWQEFTF